MRSFIILDKRCSNKMDLYRLQELQWKQDNDYPLTREEELLLIELNRKAIDLLDDWVNTNY